MSGAAVLFPIPSPCGCYSPSRGTKNASISPRVQAADPDVYKRQGQPIVLYVAALGNVDRSLVEAAEVDLSLIHI